MSKPHRLEVELHVCDHCGTVSKIAATYAHGGTFFCTGPNYNPHKRLAMRPRLFREVVRR